MNNTDFFFCKQQQEGGEVLEKKRSEDLSNDSKGSKKQYVQDFDALGNSSNEAFELLRSVRFDMLPIFLNENFFVNLAVLEILTNKK